MNYRNAGRLYRSGVWSILALLLSAGFLAYFSQVARSSQSAPALVVWVEPSLKRVGQHDAAGSASAIELWSARGEYESFQIVVQAKGAPLTNVRVSVSDLISPEGKRISNWELTLYREHYVTVTQGSPDHRGSNRPLGAGTYADALIPFLDPVTGFPPPTSAQLRASPFDVETEMNQAVWVDVFTPRGAWPGSYEGTFEVESDQGTFSGRICLHVWNFVLPLKSYLKSSFAFGNGASGTLDEEIELLKNRLSPVSSDPVNQRLLIDTYGLNSANLGMFSNATYGKCELMRAAPDVAKIKSRAARQQPDLFVYNFTADEVGSCTAQYEILLEWAGNLHRAGVRNLITMAPTSALRSDGLSNAAPAVDIWVVTPGLYDRSVQAVKEALAAGQEVWSYNSLVQDPYSPKWLIDFDPINFRIQPGFINQSLDLTGLLYWRVDRWTSDPWNDVNNIGHFAAGNNYPGDGMLVYPGAELGIGSIAPSMRLKWLRDGVDDFDYIQLLRNSARWEWALKIVRQIGPDWTNWTRSPVLLESARRQLGDELDRLSRIPTTPPPRIRR